jgi:hypothetical protein
LTQRANSLALEKQMDSQVKLRVPLWPANLPAQESLWGYRSAQAKYRG